MATGGAKSLLGEAINKLNELGGILGIVSAQRAVIPAEIEELAKARAQLKQDKKYKEADEIRDKVLVLGFTIEDVQGGQFRILPKT